MNNPLRLLSEKLQRFQQTDQMQWTARCPAHPDQNPSLSISLGDEGQALLHCHAGCSVEEICQSLGLDMSELFPRNANMQFTPARRARRQRRCFPSWREALAHLEQRRGPRFRAWAYRDGNGYPAGKIVRWNMPDEKKVIRPISKTDQGWSICAMTEPRPLYRLQELAEADNIIVCEGERCANLFRHLGFTATASSGGSNAASKSDWTPLSGKNVAIFPDNDNAGQRYANEVVEILQSLSSPPQIKEISFPGLAEGGDVVDWYEVQLDGDKDRMHEEIQEMIDQAPVVEQQRRTAAARPSRGNRGSQASRLVEMCDGMPLCHDRRMRPFIAVSVDDHVETMRVERDSFTDFLLSLFYQKTGSVPSEQALNEARRTIIAKTRFNAPEREVNIRVADHDNAYWVDLCDEQWRAVRIDSQGWAVVSIPEFLFCRTPSMSALPVPQPGGDLDNLTELLNVGSQAWTLIKLWIVSAIRPRGPYPILFLNGEQGTGKSTMARMLQALVDPSPAHLRSAPRTERDMLLSAENCWLTAYDNLSHIPSWLSDALCRLSTGGGQPIRRLYSNEEVVLFDAKRPVVINGIEDLATRGDLLSRAIVAPLSRIDDEQRLTETELWQQFEQIRPSMLGALLDAVSIGLSRESEIEPVSLPRMADAALWGIACAPALGLTEEEVEGVFAANLEATNAIALEASPVANAVIMLARRRPRWTGTATELLEALERGSHGGSSRQNSWPRTPRGLSGILRRLAPSLRDEGVDVQFDRVSGGNRTRRITLVGDLEEAA